MRPVAVLMSLTVLCVIAPIVAAAQNAEAPVSPEAQKCSALT